MYIINFLCYFVLNISFSNQILPPTDGRFFYSDIYNGEEYGSLYVEALYGRERCAIDAPDICWGKPKKMKLSISTSESQIGLWTKRCPEKYCNVIPKENYWNPSGTGCVYFSYNAKSDTIK